MRFVKKANLDVHLCNMQETSLTVAKFVGRVLGWRLAHLEQRPFKYPDCGSSLKQAHNLKLHQVIHSSDTPYKCSHCGKAFKHRKHIKIHGRIRTGEKPYSCDQCEKYFVSTRDLSVHRRVHSEKRNSVLRKSQERKSAQSVRRLFGAQKPWRSTREHTLKRDCTIALSVV